MKTDDFDFELPKTNIISTKSKEFNDSLIGIKEKNSLIIPLGKIDNNIMYENILNFPNLLIGGTIATGKTSFLNSVICSLIMTNTPKNLKLLICDSKTVDYSIFENIPHLMAPIITDGYKLEILLSKILEEINIRYNLLKEFNKRNLRQYNIEQNYKKIPYILLIIDELTSFNIESENINLYLEQISQLGWNVGVISIVVVNHPSTRVISSIAKGNFSSRMAFKTTSMKDSKLIIDNIGAEKLCGIGNALYSTINDVKIKNIKTFLIDDNDIKNIVDYVILQNSNISEYSMINDRLHNYHDDPLYNEIVDYVIQEGKISASLIQRKYKLGYNRAARIIDLLEERGIVGSQNGSKPREVLVKLEN